MSPALFDRYVAALDKPLIDLIHNAGSRVWVHCHGKMTPVLERFVNMGVDVLNPIEPPPMGDITLEQAFARVGRRMGLEGNIETHDVMVGTPEVLRPKIMGLWRPGGGGASSSAPARGMMRTSSPSRMRFATGASSLKKASDWRKACASKTAPLGPGHATPAR